ncbi:MAG: tetratricopeptide repeat protein, partial [Flammeovirgaceae bacterium]
MICTFLCAPYFSDAQLSMGDSLLSAGDFSNASIAFEYLIFKSDNSELRVEHLIKKSFAQKQLNRFNDAFETLQRIDIYSINDSLACHVLYQSALVAYLAHKPDVSFSKLVEMRERSQSDGQKWNAKMLEILALNDMHRWDEAHLVFLQFKEMVGKDLMDLYLDAKEFKLKSIRKTEMLSYFLPGAGQWYAGHFMKGLFSGIINAGLVAFSAISFYNGYYLSGAFTGVSLFYLFYNGGIRYAKELVAEKNELKAKK